MHGRLLVGSYNRFAHRVTCDDGGTARHEGGAAVRRTPSAASAGHQEGECKYSTVETRHGGDAEGGTIAGERRAVPALAVAAGALNLNGELKKTAISCVREQNLLKELREHGHGRRLQGGDKSAERRARGSAWGGGGRARELVRGDVGDGHRPGRHPDPHLTKGECARWLQALLLGHEVLRLATGNEKARAA